LMMACVNHGELLDLYELAIFPVITWLDGPWPSPPYRLQRSDWVVNY
jgi:hypothetical protein